MKRLGVAVVLLVSACSLPLPRDVKAVGEVRADVQQPAQLNVLPPGPKKGQIPSEVVSGFLGAQASSANQHGIARQFLSTSPPQVWDDTASVKVYRADDLVISLPQPDPQAVEVTVKVTSTFTGEVDKSGRYTAIPKDKQRESESYNLEKHNGTWQLSGVPDGLRLTAADLQRAYTPHDVYYLALTTRSGSQPHLVPDRVFVPGGKDLATSLMRRLLADPSAAIKGAVSDGLRRGLAPVTLRSLTHGPGGVITVDLQGSLDGLTSEERQDLSARIVWTLRADPTFQSLRLLADGKQVSVPEAGALQDAGSWDSYDPQGLGVMTPYFFTTARRLGSNSPLVSTGLTVPADSAAAIGVDAVAVTPDRATIGVLTNSRNGRVSVYTGTLRDTPQLTASGQHLTSPSWGSNAFGLWLLQDQDRVVIADAAKNGLVDVPFPRRPPGAITSLAVSRDGARVALVIAGQLWMTHVDPSGSTPRLVGATLVAPDLSKITGLAWSTATSLVVLGTLAGNADLIRVAVDGSTLAVVPTAPRVPTSVAATEDTVLIGSDGVIYSAGHGPPVPLRPGAGPVFPG